jgi:hypothetical protein
MLSQRTLIGIEMAHNVKTSLTQTSNLRVKGGIQVDISEKDSTLSHWLNTRETGVWGWESQMLQFKQQVGTILSEFIFHSKTITLFPSYNHLYNHLYMLKSLLLVSYNTN